MLNHCFIVGFFSKAAASRAVIMQECLLGDCFVCIHKIRISLILTGSFLSGRDLYSYCLPKPKQRKWYTPLACLEDYECVVCLNVWSYNGVKQTTGLWERKTNWWCDCIVFYRWNASHHHCLSTDSWCGENFSSLLLLRIRIWIEQLITLLHSILIGKKTRKHLMLGKRY